MNNTIPGPQQANKYVPLLFGYFAWVVRGCKIVGHHVSKLNDLESAHVG